MALLEWLYMVGPFRYVYIFIKIVKTAHYIMSQSRKNPHKHTYKPILKEKQFKYRVEKKLGKSRHIYTFVQQEGEMTSVHAKIDRRQPPCG